MLSLVQREAWHDTQVVFFVASYTIFLSSFFRFDVLLRPRKLHIVDSSSNPRIVPFWPDDVTVKAVKLCS
jgi:hypothetical protein